MVIQEKISKGDIRMSKLTRTIIFTLSFVTFLISLKLFWNMGVYVDEAGTSPDKVCGGDFWLYMDWLRLLLLCAALVHFWDNMYYVQILDRMDCGVSLSDVKIELINEDRGGMTNDGVSLYKMTIKDKFDINEMDFSEWSELPISDSIVDYYMIDTQEAGRYVTSVENGSWKIIGKNKEEGIYRNIEIYVYDEDERCLYAYKWDS